MSRRPTRDELRLWNAVARTVTPTRQTGSEPASKNLTDLRDEMAALMRADAHHPAPRKQKAPSPARKPVHPSRKADLVSQKPVQKRLKPPLSQNALDEKAFRDIRKGRLPIDGKLDLHGLTQAQAHAALDNYIAARASGRRHVLVITGKGRGNDGVLKRAVPVWLSMPPLSFHVNGVREAHGQHGGSGALYVRLRRPA